MTYMVSTIVLALVDNMGAIIWEKKILMPHEFCLWVDLSADADTKETPSPDLYSIAYSA